MGNTKSCVECRKSFKGDKGRCPECSDKMNMQDAALVCSACKATFNCDYLGEEERKGAHCPGCAQQTRIHVKNLDYKIMDLGQNRCYYPNTMEEVVENKMKACAAKNATLRGIKAEAENN